MLQNTVADNLRKKPK